MAIVAGIGLYWLGCLLLVCWIHSVVTAQNGQWQNCDIHVPMTIVVLLFKKKQC